MPDDPVEQMAPTYRFRFSVTCPAKRKPGFASSDWADADRQGGENWRRDAHARRVRHANCAHQFDLDADRTRLSPRRVKAAGEFNLIRSVHGPAPSVVEAAGVVLAWLRFTLEHVYGYERGYHGIEVPGVRLTVEHVL